MTKEEAIKALIKERKTALHENKQAFDMAIKALEQQPCEDAISREQAIRATYGFERYTGIDEAPYEYAESILRDLPPVTPTRKKGEWIFTKTKFDRHGCTVECSSCHKKWKTYDEIRWKKENKYCPNCGAEMESEE